MESKFFFSWPNHVQFLDEFSSQLDEVLIVGFQDLHSFHSGQADEDAERYLSGG